MVDKPTHNAPAATSFLAEHQEIAHRVRQASRFSVTVPVLGRIGVPPPKQLAAYGVLGVLAAVGAVEWPVAVSLGLGIAVVGQATRQAAAPTVDRPPASLPTAPTCVVEGRIAPPPGPTARRAARTPHDAAAARHLAGRRHTD